MTTTRSPDHGRQALDAPEGASDIDTANTPKKPEDPDALIYDIREVAYLMKVSVKTARRRVKEGYPHSRKGPRAPIKVSREDLPYWYEAERIGPQPTRRRTSRRAS